MHASVDGTRAQSDISPHQMGISLNILSGNNRFIHSRALLILFCLHVHFPLRFSQLWLPLQWPPVTLASHFSSSASISYSRRRGGGLELWGSALNTWRHLLPPLSPLLSVSEGAEAQPEPWTVRRAEELTEGPAELPDEAGNPQPLWGQVTCRGSRTSTGKLLVQMCNRPRRCS